MSDGRPIGWFGNEDYASGKLTSSRRKVMKSMGTITLGSVVLSSDAAAATKDLRYISYGETKMGEVDPYDPMSHTVGVYYEPVRFTGSAGDEVTAAIWSDMFDVVVWALITPSGKERPFGGLANPSTEPDHYKSDTITLNENGEYTLRIGNSRVDRYGYYQLRLSKEGTSGDSGGDSELTPEFTITGGETDEESLEAEVGTEITFDASTSTTTAGSIQQYEFDLDGDGQYEVRTDQATTTQGFSTIGDKTISLRVTDDQGRTATTTQSITVHLDDYFETIQRARQIDESSVMAVIEELLPDDQSLDAAEERARQTLTALETAVIDERLEQETAQTATTRLLLGEAGALHTVHRVGPSTPDVDGQAMETFNLAERLTRQVVNLALSLLVVAVGVAAAASGGTVGGLAAIGVVPLALDAVGTFLGDMFGDDATKQEAHKQCREQADTLIEQLRTGAISTVNDLVQAIDQAADQIVDTITDGVRAVVDLSAADLLISQTGFASLNSGFVLLGAGSSVYRSLDTLYAAFQPDNISTGLAGSTDAAATAVANYTTAVDDTLAESVELIENLSFAASELGVFESLLDAFNQEEPPLTDLLTVLGAAVDAFYNGVVSVVTSASAVLAGMATVSYLKTQQTALIDAVLDGQEVSFPHV